MERVPRRSGSLVASLGGSSAASSDLPCLALPSLPCLAFLALPCLALPCLALPCLVLPCLALPCLALPCLALSCLVLSCRGAHFGLPCAPVGCPRTHLHRFFGSHGTTWAPLATFWTLFGLHCGSLGHCRCDFWAPRGTPLAPFGQVLEATSAFLPTCLRNGPKNHSFYTFLGRFFDKAVHEIRPRLCSRNTHLAPISETFF